MTFKEWYKKEYKNNLDEDFAQIGIFIWIVEDEYKEYCNKNNIKPYFS